MINALIGVFSYISQVTAILMANANHKVILVQDLILLQCAIGIECLLVWGETDNMPGR